MTNAELVQSNEAEGQQLVSTGTCPTSNQCDTASVTKSDIKRKRYTSISDSYECPVYTDTTYTFVEIKCKRQKLDLHASIAANAKKCSVQLNNSDNETKSNPSKENQKPTAVNQLQLKYDNIHTNTVQKMTTYAERLRQEIGTLKAALANEQNTVRNLR